jgi:hypothetical protein
MFTNFGLIYIFCCPESVQIKTFP